MKYIFFLIVLISGGCYGQLRSYHYKQPIEGVSANTWHRVTLPESAFGKLQSGYTDVRIYGVSATDTIEVPYVVDKTDTLSHRKVLPFSVVNFKEYKQSNIRVTLPFTLRMNEVEVITSATYDYYRTLNLVKNNDISLLTSVLSSKKHPCYRFGTQLITDLQIIILNDDNAPLPISEIAVYTVPYSLKARFGEGEYQYFLAYGKANDYAPTYDITHFAKDIPQELGGVQLGKVTDIKPLPPVTAVNTPTDEGSSPYPDMLWVVMGVIVALIFVFGAKMVKTGKR